MSENDKYIPYSETPEGKASQAEFDAFLVRSSKRFDEMDQILDNMAEIHRERREAVRELLRDEIKQDPIGVFRAFERRYSKPENAAAWKATEQIFGDIAEKALDVDKKLQALLALIKSS